MKLSLGLLGTVAAMTLSSPAVAGDVVTYVLTSTTNPTFKASNIASTALTFPTITNNSAEGIGNDGFGSVFEAYSNFGAVDPALSLATNSYFSISVLANVGQTLGITGLTFDVGKGGNNDPRGLFIRSSADNYTTNLFSLLLPVGNAQVPTKESVNFGNLFLNSTSTTFRFYTYVPTTANSVDFRNIDFTSSTPAVPEPATWAMMILGMGAVGLAMRRGVRASEVKFNAKIKRIAEGAVA